MRTRKPKHWMNPVANVGNCSHWVGFGVRKVISRVPTGSFSVKADYEKHSHLPNVGRFAKYYFEVCVVTRTGYVVSVATLSC